MHAASRVEAVGVVEVSAPGMILLERSCNAATARRKRISVPQSAVDIRAGLSVGTDGDFPLIAPSSEWCRQRHGRRCLVSLAGLAVIVAPLPRSRHSRVIARGSGLILRRDARADGADKIAFAKKPPGR